MAHVRLESFCLSEGPIKKIKYNIYIIIIELIYSKREFYRLLNGAFLQFIWEAYAPSDYRRHRSSLSFLSYLRYPSYFLYEDIRYEGCITISLWGYRRLILSASSGYELVVKHPFILGRIKGKG